MGNCFRGVGHHYSGENDETRPQGLVTKYQGGPLGSHGVTVETVGFAAFARDLFHFEVTGTVPEGLSHHVKASKNAQALWYGKLLVAWKTSNPPPGNALEASHLVIQTLQGHRRGDVQKVLAFYGLPPYTPPPVAQPAPSLIVPAPALPFPPFLTPSPLPPGVQYQLTTLPIDKNQVTDGDTLIVYVEVGYDVVPGAFPDSVLQAVAARRTARIQHDFKTADALQKQVQQAGYKVYDAQDGRPDILGHKYRVRLRGVDAPEKAMPYGLQSKAFLSSLVEGRSLRILVYTTDQYGRVVADVYVNDMFVQEALLRSGWVWHYVAYDKRPQLSQWEQEARQSRVGLWANSNPQKPWEFRKAKRSR
eukprot:TRINITY_DN2839_c0_g1_i1.p1 TRINITY_DN2839_c0_g1~~TRINITY_DN2839_c0_g1_i1.p1  ORF type:complete len:362 (-),score=44.28 TRINITY_DN2839_c0_g1_i1:106-1191(-)